MSFQDTAEEWVRTAIVHCCHLAKRQWDSLDNYLQPGYPPPDTPEQFTQRKNATRDVQNKIEELRDKIAVVHRLDSMHAVIQETKEYFLARDHTDQYGNAYPGDTTSYVYHVFADHLSKMIITSTSIKNEN
jgi:hypothetical protein